MKSFSEKSDKVLYFFKTFGRPATGDELFNATGIKEDDPLINHLRNKFGYLKYSDGKIHLTERGLEFISLTSFTKERDKASL